jgi:geranyl-CoA carboxylase beta subunit
VIESRIAAGSETFLANRAANLALLEELRAIDDKLRAEAEASRERFHKRGQLLPSERLAHVLDRGAPWLGLSPLAGYLDESAKPSDLMASSLLGVGYISGVRCLVVAHNSAYKGGTTNPIGLDKYLRAQEIATGNKLPVVILAESGGANLLYQADIFVRGGRGFRNQARMSAAGIPQITVVHGSSTAGGAYLPGLSDYVIVVRGKTKIFLAGPPLLKAATGEIATDEELGGAEMHATVSGTAEYLAEDDAEALRVVRELMAKLPWNGQAPPDPPREFPEPLYPAEDLLGIVPPDYRKPYDAHEVIARVVDGSEFLDFKPLYGAATVCGHGAVEGHPCGILANNGPIDPAGSVKAAQFIQLCCQSGTPLLYLQNTTGYLVGKEAESGGAIKHGSKMIQAVANATVPQLTVIVGASFGAGNYGMCGRAYDPRFLFSWPNARIAVMGGEQAAGVMATILEEKQRRSGVAGDAAALARMKEEIVRQFDRQSTALYATSRLWDDGIIDPRDTRKVLGFCLSICREADARRLRPNTFGVARM